MLACLVTCLRVPKRPLFCVISLQLPTLFSHHRRSHGKNQTTQEASVDILDPPVCWGHEMECICDGLHRHVRASQLGLRLNFPFLLPSLACPPLIITPRLATVDGFPSPFSFSAPALHVPSTHPSRNPFIPINSERSFGSLKSLKIKSAALV